MFSSLMASAALAGTVSLTAADGASLSAELWGSGDRAVLFVHDEGKSRADWASVAPRVASAGMMVLAIDLRGHGASGKGPLTEADWPKLEQDVAAGLKYLTSKGATQIHVVGARYGAALALQAASKDPNVDDVVLLSPPLTAHGLKLSVAAPAYGARPMLVVTSTEDPLLLKAAGWLDSTATGNHRLLTYPNSGGGAAMVNTVAELQTELLGWLGGQFDPAVAEQQSLAGSVKTEVGDVETKGTRLEDRGR